MSKKTEYDQKITRGTVRKAVSSICELSSMIGKEEYGNIDSGLRLKMKIQLDWLLSLPTMYIDAKGNQVPDYTIIEIKRKLIMEAAKSLFTNNLNINVSKEDKKLDADSATLGAIADALNNLENKEEIDE